MPGHVKKRRYSSGREVWRARYPDPIKGGTAQISKQFDSKRGAEAWLAEQTTSIRHGSHVNPRDGDRLVADLATVGRALRPGELVELAYPHCDPSSEPFVAVRALRTHQWIEHDEVRREVISLPTDVPVPTPVSA